MGGVAPSLAIHVDASEFDTLAEQAVDLLATQAGAFTRGEEECGAVAITTLFDPRGQDQLLVEQFVGVLAEFFDGALGAFAAIAANAAIANVLDGQRRDLAGAQRVAVAEQEHGVLACAKLASVAKNLKQLIGLKIFHASPRICSVLHTRIPVK